MTSDVVLCEKSDGVATVTLNQPATLNAITIDTLDRLRYIVDDVARDPDVRAVILTGAGRGFCSGANLMGGSAQTLASGGMGVRSIILTMNNVLMDIVEMEKPWLAAVNGPAVGAGCSLALACDLVVAAESAYLAAGFVKVGMVLDMGSTFLLPRLVGLRRAAEMALLGERVYAPQAVTLGLINRAAPGDALMDTAREWAARLAAGPTLAIGAIKLGLQRGLTGSLRDALYWEAMMQSLVAQTEDAAEGFMAFLQKRPPDFKGR